MFYLRYTIIIVLFLQCLTTAQQNSFIVKDHLYGDIDGRYGQFDCNPSVKNLLATIQKINTQKQSSKLFSFNNKKQGIPPVGLITHAQGVARIAGVGDENWFVFTKSGETPEQSGFIFARFNKLQSSGKAWVKAKNKQENWDYGQSQVFFSDVTHKQDHPGAIQSLGRILVVGSDGQNGTLVDFYDMTNPHRIEHLNRHKIDGSQGERKIGTGGKGASAHFVSAAKLRDGRYLLFVAKHTRVSWGHPKGYGWFYTSSSTIIDKSTKWKYISFCTYIPKGNAYQSANILTESPSGELYLAMMGPDFLQKNYLEIWKLKPHSAPQQPDDTIELKLTMTKTVWSRADGGTFDAGGGIHITPEGKAVIYMIDRWQDFDGHIKLEEYCE